MRAKKVNYLNNRDMLSEIHKSKLSYCYYLDEKHTDYDGIIYDISDITRDFIKESVLRRINREAHQNYRQYLSSDDNSDLKLKDFKRDPVTVDIRDLVFRIITWDHIPQDTKRKKTHKTTADKHIKLNFVPFKHFIFNDCIESIEHLYELIDSNNLSYEEHLSDVLWSHCKNNKFSKNHGQISNKLAKMYMMMVERYAQKSNWRGYSYLDEMKGKAIIELTAKGLFFNEEKSDNPFAYFTQVITNGFRIILNEEKKSQNIRDELMMNSGMNPSISKQLEHELKINEYRNSVNDE